MGSLPRTTGNASNKRCRIVGGVALVALAYVSLTIVGMARWYSPVPFWDMWGTYLYAYMAYLDGTWRNLFAQTNEHQVWISNIFYFWDIRFFGGRSLLLQPLNFLLAVGLWLTLAAIARRLLRAREDIVLPVILLLAAPTFSWLQEPNFTWGYQTQFFLAYLLPLAAFSCLAMAGRETAATRWFIGAVFLGIASLGSMANGVLVLPLMAVMALLQNTPRRAAMIAAIAALTLTFWFHGYRFVPRPSVELWDALVFVLSFLGLPFALILGAKAGLAAGFVFVAASIAHGWRWLRRATAREPLTLGLLVMLGYIGLSAASMALGRGNVEGAALALRYATPSLLGWSILGLLTLHAFLGHRRCGPIAAAAGIAIAIGLLPRQLTVMSDVGPITVHDKMYGALALKLRVRDPDTIDNIYPVDPDSLQFVWAVAADAERRGLSIMGEPALTAAAREIGKPAAAGFSPCAGHVDFERPTPDGQFNRVTGWIFDAEKTDVPKFVYIAGADTIEGIGVTGLIRRDVAEIVHARALMGGFSGFVRTNRAEKTLRILCRRE